MSPAVLLSDILRCRDIGDPCRALLVALMTVEIDPKCHRGCYSLRDGGMVRICREELADALGGITLKAVSNRIAEAVRAGLLKHESGGRNGQVAGYRVIRPYRRPGPQSLADLLAATLGTREEALVGTTPVVPGEDSEPLVGTTGIAPYARAQYSTDNAAQQPAPDETRAERDDDVTEQAGTYRGWHHPVSRRSSLAGSSERFPDERPTGEVA